MKKVFIVRHGRTEWNLEVRIQGANGDSPLLETSIEDIKTTGKFLSNFDFVKVYSSPLPRAVKTAELLGISEDIILEPRVKELGFGTLEGKTRAELNEKDPVMYAKLAARISDPYFDELGVENFAGAAARFKYAIEDIAANLEDGQNALVVSHGAIMQLGLKLLTGYQGLNNLKNTSTTILIFDDDNNVKLETFNETGYLANQNAKGNTTL